MRELTFANDCMKTFCEVKPKSNTHTPRRTACSPPHCCGAICKRLVMYCQPTSVSTAHTTHCDTYCTPCRPLIRAFSGWIRTPPPTSDLKHKSRARSEIRLWRCSGGSHPTLMPLGTAVECRNGRQTGTREEDNRLRARWRRLAQVEPAKFYALSL